MKTRNDRERYSQIAGRWVRGAWQEAPPRLMAPSKDLVGAVAGELRARRRRRVLVRWAAVSAASATGIAGMIALVWTLGRQASPLDSGRPVATAARSDADAPARSRESAALVLLGGELQGGAPTLRNRPLAVGTRLMASVDGSVRIGSSDGTRLTIQPGGTLAVVETGDTRRLALMRGAVDVQVRKLFPGERFIVDTADAEIEVHGTAFRVALVTDGTSCPESATTRVSVSEGVVSVSAGGHQERLVPGDEWPPRCVAAERSRTVVADPPLRDSRHRAASKSSRRAEKLAAAGSRSPARQARALAAASVSALEAQNDLFSSAVASKRAGRIDEALVLFDRFIHNYPDSSLAESALVQRMRLLAARDPRAAAGAADAYLRRFPDGFARGEARALQGAPSTP